MKHYHLQGIISYIIFTLFMPAMLMANNFTVTSPDKNITVTVKTYPKVTWSVQYGNKTIIPSVTIGLQTGDNINAGSNERIKRVTNSKTDTFFEPVVAHKKSKIQNRCNTLALSFRSGFTIHFRVYNDGVAYRWESSIKKTITVNNEISEITFPSGTMAWYPLEKSFYSHNENTYIYSSLDTITDKHLSSLPVLFKSENINVLITESDIEDYPGMWLRGKGNGSMYGVWPAYPDEEKQIGDRDVKIVKTKNYIAKVSGKRTFPWRAFIISANDGGLIESDMVARLAAPNRLTDTDWIKPGKVAWDWWNNNNIYGVDFKAGINTETYKYYIDFASENGLQYIILDEGWYNLNDVLSTVPDVDVAELCRYGESKNVGVILWVTWKALYDKMETAFNRFESWGVKGVKVDFMQRDDQWMVNFYHKAAQMAADHKMLIDFHGSYKPDGLGITYPNALTREGVKGLEQAKWCTDANPEHDVTIPFTRMVAGPMDYTPGAMVNMGKENFNPMYSRPASLGTRVHQMAMYVIYESPLQMLADNPSNYRREQECTDFIAKVPVVWDDIKVLDAKVGDYLIVARRSGDKWFIGAMTDWTARSVKADLSFLEKGDYTMELFSDGINADRFAQDYRHKVINVKSGDIIDINMGPGGGWVAVISKSQTSVK